MSNPRTVGMRPDDRPVLTAQRRAQLGRRAQWLAGASVQSDVQLHLLRPRHGYSHWLPDFPLDHPLRFQQRLSPLHPLLEFSYPI